jgi:hypothetical protein
VRAASRIVKQVLFATSNTCLGYCNALSIVVTSIAIPGVVSGPREFEWPRIRAMRKLPVVPNRYNLFSCAVRANQNDHPRVSLPHEGRFAIVTDVGSRMRWTQCVVRRTT